MRALPLPAIILLAFAAVGCTSWGLVQAPGPLDEGGLHGLMSEGLVASFQMLDDQGRIGYRPDGTMSIKGFAVADGGSWRIDGDRLCQRWRHLRAGAERCLAVERLARDRYALREPDGTLVGSLTVY